MKNSGNYKNTYIKVDGNIIINEQNITWVKQMDECLLICAKKDGCDKNCLDSVHKLCKINNPDSYNNLNNMFYK